MKKLALAALFLLSIFAIGCKKQEAPMTPAVTTTVATSTTTVATPAAATPAADTTAK